MPRSLLIGIDMYQQSRFNSVLDSNMKTVLLFITLVGVCFGAGFDRPLDLSWPYEEDNQICFANNFKFLTKEFNEKEGGVWWVVQSFSLAEHCGTHIDAPYHFDPNGLTLEKLSIENFLVNAILIDAVAETGDNPNYTMPLSKVKDWETENGPIPNHTVVLVRFGWGDKYYYDREKYLIKDGVYRWPGISPEVSQYLLDSKKVVGVGSDNPSVDSGLEINQGTYTNHVLLLKSGVYILENIKITHDMALPPQFKLIVAPIKIAGASGGATRLLALPKNFSF